MATTTVVGVVTTREVPLTSVILEPADNYRWGSVEAMNTALKRDAVHLAQMADSLRNAGLINPIGVRPDGRKWRIIYGFNRFIAARAAGLTSLRAQVYPPTISHLDVSALQVAENNDDLRKSVGWVREIEQCLKLHAAICKQIEAMPVDQRPRNKRGALLGVKNAAWDRVSAMTGKSDLTLIDRYNVYRHLHPDVVALAREHDWSVSATREFYSGDLKNLYAPDFVTAVLAELRRCAPALQASSITPTVVRLAKARVSDWLAQGRGADGKPLWRASGKAEAAPARPTVALTRTYTPSALRDLAVNLMCVAVAAAKVTPESPESVWQALAASPTAARCSGLGMASGDVPLPDTVTDLAVDLSSCDVPVRAQHFVTATLVFAAVRHFIATRTDWQRWFAGSTVRDAKSCTSRSNAFLLRRAVAEAMEADSRNIRAKVLAAWCGICEAGAVHGA